jgi:aspartyl/asparaginyl beta-hydroxylase (cupin superfamily)
MDFKAIQARLAEAQASIEKEWPLPYAEQTFNLSIRDLMATVLICLAVRVLFLSNIDVWLKFGLCVAACAAEPALLVLPYNVLHALVQRSPRYWDPLVIEPKLQRLLEYFPDLQAEARGIAASDLLVDFAKVNPFQRRIATNQPWKVFPFFSYGTVNEDNCKRAPITTSILRQIPSVRLAMYSVMSSGAEIPTHCGFFKSAIRIHLTLHTDADDVHGDRYIEVGGQRYSWKTGEMVAFDDTYPHRVHNKVPGSRIVLFLDVDRPYSNQVFQYLSNVMGFLMRHSPNVKSIAAKQELTRNL